MGILLERILAPDAHGLGNKTYIIGNTEIVVGFINCKRLVEVNDEDYQVDPEYGGPEYETLGALYWATYTPMTTEPFLATERSPDF